MPTVGPDGSSYLYNAGSALNPQPAIQWCVEGLLPGISLSMLVGASGSKKSFLATDLAVCVAMGKPWLGRAVRPGPVLFIDEQTGVRALKARIGAALKAHQATAETPLHFTSLAGYNLREEESANSLIDLAECWSPSLIIIDGFANLLGGSNESSLGACLPVLFQLRFLAEFMHTAVLVTHYTNRHGVFQGSAAISAAMDLMLAIRSDPSDTLIQVDPIKSRFFSPPPFAARAHFDTLADGSPTFHLTPESDPEVGAGSPRPSTTEGRRDEAKDLIKVPPGVIGLAFNVYMNDFHRFDQLTFKEIRAHHQGDSESSIRNAVQQLLTERAIVRSDEGGQGAEATYTLAQSFRRAKPNARPP